MTFRHLKIFRAVVSGGSLTEAAEQLRISQPAVSMQMKELQTELGVRLFSSRGRHLDLTPAGSELLTYADRILSLSDEARVAVQARERHGGVIRVAASSTPGVNLLPSLIARFQKRAPDTDVRLQVANTQTVEQKLRAHEADIGVVGGRLTSAELTAEPWLNDELVLIVSPTHRLSRSRAVSAKELGGERLLVRDAGSATRTTYEAVFLSARIPLPESQLVGDTEAIKRAVAVGLGVAIVSRFAVEEERRSRKLTQLRIKGVSLLRPLQLLYDTDQDMTAPAAEFLDYLRSQKNRKKLSPGRRKGT